MLWGDHRLAKGVLPGATLLGKATWMGHRKDSTLQLPSCPRCAPAWPAASGHVFLSPGRKLSLPASWLGR